jgi:hypothetical protein
MSFQLEHSELKELEDHYDIKQDFAGNALQDDQSELVMWVEAAENFHGWDKESAKVSLANMVIKSLKAYQESRLSELRQVDEKNAEPSRSEINEEHIQDRKRESGRDFARAHNEVLGARI